MNTVKDTTNNIAKIKTQITKNIAAGQKKVKSAIDKNVKELKKAKEILKKGNKNLKSIKDVASKKKLTSTIKMLSKDIAASEKSLGLLKAKQQYLKDLSALARKSIKAASGKKVAAKKKVIAKKSTKRKAVAEKETATRAIVKAA